MNDFEQGYCNRLKSRLFGLLCEYEKFEAGDTTREWEKFLDSFLVELLGYPEEQKTIYYYILYYKISSLRYLSHKYFKTTVFDCISLVEKAYGK